MRDLRLKAALARALEDALRALSVPSKSSLSVSSRPTQSAYSDIALGTYTRTCSRARASPGSASQRTSSPTAWCPFHRTSIPPRSTASSPRPFHLTATMKRQSVQRAHAGGGDDDAQAATSVTGGAAAPWLWLPAFPMARDSIRRGRCCARARACGPLRVPALAYRKMQSGRPHTCCPPSRAARGRRLARRRWRGLHGVAGGPAVGLPLHPSLEGRGGALLLCLSRVNRQQRGAARERLCGGCGRGVQGEARRGAEAQWPRKS